MGPKPISRWRRSREMITGISWVSLIVSMSVCFVKKSLNKAFSESLTSFFDVFSYTSKILGINCSFCWHKYSTTSLIHPFTSFFTVRENKKLNSVLKRTLPKSITESLTYLLCLTTSLPSLPAEILLDLQGSVQCLWGKLSKWVHHLAWAWKILFQP